MLASADLSNIDAMDGAWSSFRLWWYAKLAAVTLEELTPTFAVVEDVDKRFIARRISRSRSSSCNARSSVEPFSGGSGVGFMDSGIAESADEDAVETLLVREGMVEATESVVSVEDSLLKLCDEEVDGMDGRSRL